MKKLLIIVSLLILTTACQQDVEEYITQTTELSALDKFSSNPQKQEPNISNIESSSSTRAYQSPGGFVVNIIWFANVTFGDWNSHVILSVPYSTIMNRLETLANSYSAAHYQPIHVAYYWGNDYYNIKIGLRTPFGYVASEMFIRDFLRDFASYFSDPSLIGTRLDFEFYVTDED